MNQKLFQRKRRPPPTLPERIRGYARRAAHGDGLPADRQRGAVQLVRRRREQHPRLLGYPDGGDYPAAGLSVGGDGRWRMESVGCGYGVCGGDAVVLLLGWDVCLVKKKSRLLLELVGPSRKYAAEESQIRFD
uniref:Uncharacterized protein n=1 Tax=Mycena chlorophos TaxID=658473 RepID=A0ABQ0L8E4_MYCCL|nr:predicted protein [Mycena chlorophos]